jgi:hypothetical protein
LVLVCGNGQIDPNEECDGGFGCEKCRCNRFLGLVPSSPPTVNCKSHLTHFNFLYVLTLLSIVVIGVSATFSYVDPCPIHNGNCSSCIEFNCFFCSNSGECRNSEISSDCHSISP